MDPKGYKEIFMKPFNFKNLDQILLEPQYTPVQPLYYNLSLSHSSRYHCLDMSLSNYFNHTDLKGNRFSSRIRKYTNCNSAIGENIAAGPKSGFRTNNILICEASNLCISDSVQDTEKIGHRINIMASKYSMVGVGYISTKNKKSNYSTYWTMNFGNAGKCLYDIPQNTPIHSGSHSFLNNKNESSPLFIVTFSSDKEKVDKMELHIQSIKPIIMEQILGSNSSFAVYSHQALNFTQCNWYYYLAHTNNGNTYRYPNHGVLKLATSTSYCYSWSNESLSTILKPNLILIILVIIIKLLYI